MNNSSCMAGLIIYLMLFELSEDEDENSAMAANKVCEILKKKLTPYGIEYPGRYTKMAKDAANIVSKIKYADENGVRINRGVILKLICFQYSYLVNIYNISNRMIQDIQAIYSDKNVTNSVKEADMIMKEILESELV